MGRAAKHTIANCILVGVPLPKLVTLSLLPGLLTNVGSLAACSCCTSWQLYDYVQRIAAIVRALLLRELEGSLLAEDCQRKARKPRNCVNVARGRRLYR